MSLRKEKVAQRIREEISSIIHDDIKDPRIGFLTITRVELTDDLRFAKIFYSILGNDDQKKKAKEGLESSCKYIKRLLGERIKLRYTPDIAFRIDDSAEYSIHMYSIFEKIENERKEKEGKKNDKETDS